MNSLFKLFLHCLVRNSKILTLFDEIQTAKKQSTLKFYDALNHNFMPSGILFKSLLTNSALKKYMI
jgi:hypothetical protein